MSPTPALIQPAPRLRSAVALARAVVRDLAEQDDPSGDDTTPEQQIKAWRRDAAGGDLVIVNAIDLLGEREAARVYKLGPRASTLSDAECAKLSLVARRARS